MDSAYNNQQYQFYAQQFSSPINNYFSYNSYNNTLPENNHFEMNSFASQNYPIYSSSAYSNPSSVSSYLQSPTTTAASNYRAYSNQLYQASLDNSLYSSSYSNSNSSINSSSNSKLNYNQSSESSLPELSSPLPKHSYSMNNYINNTNYTTPSISSQSHLVSSTPYQSSVNYTDTSLVQNNQPDNSFETNIVVKKAKKESKKSKSNGGDAKRPKVFKLDLEKTNIGFGTVKMENHPTNLLDEETKSTFKCVLCSQQFNTAAKLFMHQHKYHKNGSSTQCPICYKKFNSQANALVHLRAHTQEKTYKCTMCTLAFCDSSTLKKHLRTHTGEKPYNCHLCTKKFTQSGNLKRHLGVHEKYDAIQAKNFIENKSQDQVEGQQVLVDNYESQQTTEPRSEIELNAQTTTDNYQQQYPSVKLETNFDSTSTSKQLSLNQIDSSNVLFDNQNQFNQHQLQQQLYSTNYSTCYNNNASQLINNAQFNNYAFNSFSNSYNY